MPTRNQMKLQMKLLMITLFLFISQLANSKSDQLAKVLPAVPGFAGLYVICRGWLSPAMYDNLLVYLKAIGPIVASLMSSTAMMRQS